MYLMSVSKLATSYTVKTILQKINETQNAVDIDASHYLKHTLNVLYDLWSAEVPNDTSRLRYFGMGINGRYNVDSEGLMGAYDPLTTDLDLYEPVPFRCRPLDEDLTDAERAQYRIRAIREINGQRYICYFLKKLEQVDNEVHVFRIDHENGLTLPYELENRHLNPTPRKPQTNDTQASEEPDIVVGVRMNMNVTAEELYEYIDIKYKGDRRRAVISEWGVYSGEDRLIREAPNPVGPGVFSYTESIYTYLSYKTCTLGTTMENANHGMTRTLLIGSGTCIMLSDMGA